MSNQVVDQVINGTYGQVWVDGNLIGELQSFELNIEVQYADVNVANNAGSFRKAIGWIGTGTMNFNHINSKQINKMASAIKAGKTVRSTIVGTISDPDASGRETVVVRDVTFNGLQLLKFEQKTVITEDTPFSFSDFDVQDSIG